MTARLASIARCTTLPDPAPLLRSDADQRTAGKSDEASPFFKAEWDDVTFLGD